MDSQALQRFMKKHQQSAFDVAELLGVTKPAVDHWLTGRREMPLMASKVLKFLDRFPKCMSEFQ